MRMGTFADMAKEVLIPSWGEINLSLAAAVALVLIVSFLQHAFSGIDGAKQIEKERGPHLPAVSEIESAVLNSPAAQNLVKGTATKEWGSSFIYWTRLELLAAKNLISANLNGSSDPYAIITCGSQKRFSSMVPGSRNPMWGEVFDFYAEDLPVQIILAIYDWDIVWKSASLGSMTLDITEEGETEATWHMLDSSSGQVCLQVTTKRYPVSQSGSLNGYLGLIARRRMSLENPVGTEVRQKPGPLQTIFELPPDEVVEHKYSCALERSFLYHGRMYLSAWHICFHSNVFAKQMKIVVPYDDIEEDEEKRGLHTEGDFIGGVAQIKKSQHALINPAITITLRSGSGGQGVPPLVSGDGRVKYKFASFLYRNHVIRALMRAMKNFAIMQEAAKEEQQVSSMRTRSGSFRVLEEIVEHSDSSSAPPEALKVTQPFLKDDVLSEVINTELPCTAEEYFAVCLRDDSKFMQSYCDHRNDTQLQMEQWHDLDQYSGVTRKVTYRSKCRSPMCPPDTAVTVWQHSAFSSDKKVLVFEAVSQIHDVPFGSYFEVHVQWTFETKSESLCSLIVKVGAHFKKWCFMQSKIKSGTVLEMKGDAELFIELARKELETSGSTLQEDEARHVADVITSLGRVDSTSVVEPLASGKLSMSSGTY